MNSHTFLESMAERAEKVSDAKRRLEKAAENARAIEDARIRKIVRQELRELGLSVPSDSGSDTPELIRPVRRGEVDV